MRSIAKIVVHTADTPDTLDIGAVEIRQWHTDPPPKGNGWKAIGYHKIVRKNGSIEDGRPEDQIGAHVAGHNADSLGICWVGRNDCTEIQRESLKKQILEWCDKYNISIDNVYGHSELASGKSCPNIDMNEFREFLKKKVNKSEYLPDGPSEASIDITLEDIENQILDD